MFWLRNYSFEISKIYLAYHSIAQGNTCGTVISWENSTYVSLISINIKKFFKASN